MGAGSAGSSGSNDTDVSGAEAVTFGGTTYSDKKRKGFKPADYNIEKDDSFYEPPKKKNILEKIVDNSILTNNPFSKKSEEVNRKFFKEKVLPAGKSIYNTYEDYIRARGRGEVDAYGRKITQTDDGGNNQPVQETIVKRDIGDTDVPTDEKNKQQILPVEDDKYDVRKIKKKGRSKNILTSSRGVTQLSDDYSLSKKSLLGTL